MSLPISLSPHSKIEYMLFTIAVRGIICLPFLKTYLRIVWRQIHKKKDKEALGDANIICF